MERPMDWQQPESFLGRDIEIKISGFPYNIVIISIRPQSLGSFL